MLEILELIDKKCDTDPDLVDLEEAEGYARDFALEVLERLGFDKETREKHVTELANEMYLRQHPSRSPWKFGLEGWLSAQEEGDK